MRSAVVRIAGGLGNQLFQYAFGLGLSADTGRRLLLDISHYESAAGDSSITRRRFALRDFEIGVEVVSLYHVSEYFCPLSWPDRLRVWLKQILGRPAYAVLHEENYAPDKLPRGVDVYLKGYWQDERHFCAARNLILERVRLKKPGRLSGSSVYARISNAPASVGVHVRRGDYVSDPVNNRKYGVCGLDYYQRAFAHIRHSCANPEFFVFSDSPEWVAETWPMQEHLEIVSGHDFSETEELMLMSRCKHQIIANSTFGWWAAWLNENSDKVVAAPARWFADPAFEEKRTGLVPSVWVRL